MKRDVRVSDKRFCAMDSNGKIGIGVGLLIVVGAMEMSRLENTNSRSKKGSDTNENSLDQSNIQKLLKCREPYRLVPVV